MNAFSTAVFHSPMGAWSNHNGSLSGAVALIADSCSEGGITDLGHFEWPPSLGARGLAEVLGWQGLPFAEGSIASSLGYQVTDGHDPVEVHVRSGSCGYKHCCEDCPAEDDWLDHGELLNSSPRAAVVRPLSTGKPSAVWHSLCAKQLPFLRDETPTRQRFVPLSRHFAGPIGPMDCRGWVTVPLC